MHKNNNMKELKKDFYIFYIFIFLNSPLFLVRTAGEEELVDNPPKFLLSGKHSVGENVLAPQQLVGLSAIKKHKFKFPAKSRER